MRNVLARLDISLHEEPIARLEGGSPDRVELQEGKHDSFERIVFTNGEILPRRGLLLHPVQHQHSALPEKLGCTVTEDGIVEVDENGWTGIAHLYMAGDAASPAQQVVFAISSGARAALSINQELFEEDIRQHLLS
jgi:thioredoxin reductase